MPTRWTPSRYTRSIRVNGKGRMLYNAYTGAIAAFQPEEERVVQSLLDTGEASVHKGMAELEADLRDAGFLVPEGTDELLQAAQLHEALQQSETMHLVIMPTEACNFRCTYCYQTFPRGAMARELIDGLKEYVRTAARRIKHLSVSWFGGEPLLAFETIIELSDSFQQSCAETGASYTADMSTNGYLLSKDRFEQLHQRGVQRFMVTLDGAASVHDQRRKLRGGGGTFETIIANLQDIGRMDAHAHFAMDIRVNFDEGNAARVPDLLHELAENFRGDERFQLLIRPVGRWGGPHDESIPVCDRTGADTHLWNLTEHGLDQGLALSETIADTLMPSGSVCYAAKPNSLVIGADGRLYKCSIALDDDVNQVGQLHSDGRMELDEEKVALWTGSGEEKDAVCRSCYFRPACQGNHCPLYRMRTGKRPCPHEKRKLKQVMALLWKNEELGSGGE